MLIRFLISRSGQAGASSTRNRQWAWPSLKKKGRTGRSEGNIGLGGICQRDDWPTATKGPRREAVLVKPVSMVTRLWCNFVLAP